MKISRDVPKTVRRYVEEHLEQGAEEGKAWALAWSRYCKFKYPNSPRCKKDEYFKGQGKKSLKIAKRVSIAKALLDRFTKGSYYG